MNKSGSFFATFETIASLEHPSFSRLAQIDMNIVLLSYLEVSMTSALRPLAVLTALLVLAVGAQAGATYLGTDTTTQGNWIGVYGSDGYSLLDYKGGYGGATPGLDVYSLPSYVTGYSYSGDANQYSWALGTTPGGYKYSSLPENPTLSSPATDPRNATTSYTGSTMTITIDLNTAKTFQLGVYGLDWDNYGPRTASVSVDGGTAQPYTTSTGYETGQWDLWKVSGDQNNPVTITLNNLYSNAVLSAITFDSHSSPVPEPASLTLLGLGSLGLLCWRGRKRVLA